MSPGRPREILEILLLNPLPRVLSSDRSPAACDETRGAWRVGTLPIPLNSCACVLVPVRVYSPRQSNLDPVSQSVQCVPCALDVWLSPALMPAGYHPLRG